MQRAPLVIQEYWRYRGPSGNGQQETNEDLSNPSNWPLDKVVAESGFTTDTNGAARLSFKLNTAAYRVVLETQDRFGKKVTGLLPLRVLKPADTKLAIPIPHLLAAPQDERDAFGEEFAGVAYRRLLDREDVRARALDLL